MPSLKDLRSRIRSVKNTQQITKTMKMVAAAKVKRARTRVESARPYAETLHLSLTRLAASAGQGAPLLLTGRDDVRTVRILMVGSDRGLCGGFNAGLLKKTAQKVREWQAINVKVELLPVGRKMRDGARANPTLRPLLVDGVMDWTQNITFESAQTLGQQQVADFESGRIDVLQLIFGECVSMLKQDPRVQQLIPFAMGDADREKADATKHASSLIEYEPGETAVLSALLPRNISTQVFQAMLESSASEHAARMTAMDSATRNAGDMIKKLTLTYNRSRQAAITKELIEIISGAEAV